MSPRHSKEPAASEARTERVNGEPAPSPATPRPSAGAQLRQIARRVHFLAGILVAPFVLVLCLTGLVYVFSPQIHNDLYAGQFYVSQVGDAPRPVAEQVAAALAGHPEAEVRSVVPPPAPDRTTRVNLSVPGLTEPGAARTVFVDPYTNYISGELTTVDDRMPANIWLRDLHGNLHLGEAGRLYAETAASWLPAIALGGLVVWLGKQGRRPRRASEVLVPVLRGKGEQMRMRSVHGPLGLWLTVGLLAMGATGLIMSPLAGRGQFDAREPTLAMAPVDVPVNADPAGLDRVLEVARAQGLGGELKVTPPAAPDRPFTVVETSPGLPIQKDSIAVDPYTAEVSERIGWGDYSLLAQLRVLGMDAHTGVLFGLANQIILTLLMIGIIVLILGGYRMWWKRSPYRGQLPPAPQPALRQLTWPVAIPVALVTVVLGWLMPAFGISLVAFFVVDLGINAVRRRQERVRRAIAAGVLLVAGAIFGVAVLANMSSFVGQDDDPGTYQGQGTLDGGVPEAGRAAGPALAQPPPGGQAASNGAPDALTAPPTSGDPGAFPGTRVRAPAGTGTGPDGGFSTPGAGTGGTPAAAGGADDSDDRSTGGSSSSDTRASASTSGGSFGSGGDESRGTGSSGGVGGAAAPPPPVAGPAGAAPDAPPPSAAPPGLVGGLVGALTNAAAPVTSLLFSVVDGVTDVLASGSGGG